MSTVTAGVFGAVALARALDQVRTFVRTYVVLTDHQVTLVTLWIAMTHALEAFDYAAYLHIKSPLPECGKSRLLEVLAALVENPWLTGRVTAAVLMRKVDAKHPVLLLDESDAAFNGEKEYAEALRGMLNTGFHRAGTASACVGQGAKLTYQDFSTFCPKAIAGLGALPSTVESRSIPVALRRKTKDEPFAKSRHRERLAAGAPIREALATTLRPMADTLKAARPAFPDGLSDRAEDVLEPLFAIADAVSGEWADRARTAAVALMGSAARAASEADQSLALELLTDIHAIFLVRHDPPRLSTEALIKALVALEDRPWATYTKGDKPITPHRLSRMLKAFDIERRQAKMRAGNDTFRGYELTAFSDAFARYLPCKAEQAEQPIEYGPELAKTKAEHETAVPLSKTAISPDKHCSVPLVPLLTPDHQDGAGPIDSDPTGDGGPVNGEQLPLLLATDEALGPRGPARTRGYQAPRAPQAPWTPLAQSQPAFVFDPDPIGRPRDP